MPEMVELKTRMYLTLLLVFAIGFAIIYTVLEYFGVSGFGILAFGIGFFVLQWYMSPVIMKYAARLKYIGPEEYPELQSMVHLLAAQAHVPFPKIAISPSEQPNAFVFGRTKKSATLVVHQGLLKILNKDELEAVLGHEIGHIKNSDFMIMTVIAFVPMLAYLIAQNLFFSGVLGGNSKNNDGILVLMGIGAFFIYIVSELLMLYLSRSRELFADSYSAGATKKPQHLARALAKITYGLSSSSTAKQGQTDMTTRAFYIADNITAQRDMKEIEEHFDQIKRLLPELDLKSFEEKAQSESRGVAGFLGSLFSTHPPTYQRILLLAEETKGGNTTITEQS